MIEEPRCFKRRCKHFIGIQQPDGTEANEIIVCEAFPEGIPVEIAYGKNDHFKVHDKQKNNIVFEKE